MTRTALTNWWEMISAEMHRHDETFDDVVATAPSGDEWMFTAFDSGYGATRGIPFTVWTVKRVYFPACYDGAEWCESVSRNPDGQATEHIGWG